MGRATSIALTTSGNRLVTPPTLQCIQINYGTSLTRSIEAAAAAATRRLRIGFHRSTLRQLNYRSPDILLFLAACFLRLLLAGSRSRPGLKLSFMNSVENKVDCGCVGSRGTSATLSTLSGNTCTITLNAVHAVRTTRSSCLSAKAALIALNLEAASVR